MARSPGGADKRIAFFKRLFQKVLMPGPKIFLVVVSAACLVAAGLVIMKKKNPEQQGVSFRKFSCAGLERIGFHYPVFPGWEPVSPEDPKIAQSRCVIPLKNDAEIRVSVAYYGGIPGEMEAPAFLSLRNPQGIEYGVEKERSVFWIGDATVDVELAGVPDGSGFSKELFWKEVVQSFRRMDRF